MIYKYICIHNNAYDVFQGPDWQFQTRLPSWADPSWVQPENEKKI